MGPTQYGLNEVENSKHLVEEYMLVANFFVAQQLLRVHGPFAFLHHHLPPIQRSMDRVLVELNKNGISMGGSPKEIMESLNCIREERGEKIFAVVQAMLAKEMKSARYIVAGNGASPESWHHYALNIPYYTHFTAPIRRYADIVVHRLLQESLTSDHLSAADSVDEDPKNRLEELTSLAESCSKMRDAVTYAKTDCDEMYMCAYVQCHGDIEVTGVVESMGPRGFTVYIPELGMMKRLLVKEINVLWWWDKKKSQLSIGGARMIKLSFMKGLRMRVSTTKTIYEPLALTFTVLGETS